MVIKPASGVTFRLAQNIGKSARGLVQNEAESVSESSGLGVEPLCFREARQARCYGMLISSVSG